MAQQVGRLTRPSVARGYRDAHARPYVEHQALDGERLIDAGHDLVGRRLNVKVVTGRAEQDGELVAAKAPHEALRPGEAHQPPPHLPQDCVARDVAQRVVDLLEPVQVHQQDRDLARRVRLERVCEAFAEGDPVGQARQRVVVGLVLADFDLAAELLQQVAASKGHAGVGRERLEEPQVSRAETLLLGRSVPNQQVARLGVFTLERGNKSFMEPLRLSLPSRLPGLPTER